MHRKKVQKKSKIHLLILVTLITTMFSTFIAFSKYISSANGNSSGEVAFPILNYKDSEILMDALPGNTIEYVFGVSNKDENKTSEVTMKYRISIETLENLPFEFELYTFDNDECGDANLLEDENISKELDIPIQDSEIVQKYKLFIKWNKKDNNYLYSKETEYIKVETIAEQVD